MKSRFVTKRSMLVDVHSGATLVCEAVVSPLDDYGQPRDEAEVKACALVYAKHLIGHSGNGALKAEVRY